MNIKEISQLTLLAAAMVSSPAALAASSSAANSEKTSTEANADQSLAEQLVSEEDNARAGTHVQILDFDTDSVTLNDRAQDRLDNLAQTLDKSTPTKVVVKIEQRAVAGAQASAGQADDTRSSADENLADSSGANQTVGTAQADYNNQDLAADSRLSQEIQENQKLLSKHRAERVRQFLEDRDIQVEQFEVNQPNAQEPVIEQARSAEENVQNVLIVISGDSAREGLTAR